MQVRQVFIFPRDHLSLPVFITRAGVSPPEYLGHIVRIPAVPTPEALREAGLDASKLGSLEDALFGDRLAGLGKPGRLIPYGLVEPTPWERRFVAWVGKRLGLAPEAGWDALGAKAANPGLEPVAVALADPLANPPSSAPVDLVAGDDPELEALGAARAIRRWLAPQPVSSWPTALDEVVVLLPSSSSRRALWRETLSRHGLPAEATESVPLAQTSLGLWLLTLSRLAGWSDKAPATRADLRLALLAPYVSLPEGARRLDVRECLRDLRTWSVGRTDWELHVDGYFAGKREKVEAEEELSAADRKAALAELEARADGLKTLTDAIATNLAHRDERLFPGLLAVLKALRVQPRVRASKVEPANWALDRATRVLERLAHDPDPTQPAPARLEAALADQSIRVDEAPRHGVHITTYAQFDGRPARLVVLAGLEEGGWPSAPPRRSREETTLAAALGLLSPADELARQARIASAVTRLASEHLVLSWSRADEAGSQTFAGPLLAALRSTANRPGLKEQLLTEAEAVPRQADELTTPAEVLQAPWPAVGKALGGGPLEAWKRGETSATHLQALEAARDPDDLTPVGPFTGQVGVPFTGSNRFSPTSLETLGQCAMKYFLGKVLKLETKDDAGVDLDAAEVGTLLHAAFSQCAQEAIAEKGAWQLSGVAEEARERHLAKLLKRLDDAVDEAVEDQAAREPTLARALVDRLADRWKRALRGWASAEAAMPEGGVFEAGASLDPLALKPKQLETLDEETRSLVEKCRTSGLEAGLALLAKARKTAAKTAAEANRWHAEAFPEGGRTVVGKGKFAEAARNSDAKARGKALDALQADAEAAHQQRLDEATEKLEKAYLADRLAVPRRVVASEWGFGDAIADGADPASTEKPLVLSLPGGGTIEVRGRVDRLDGAEDRPDLAVVDYKTGKAKSPKVVRAELGEGRHLQLPIYALAAEALRAGKAGISKKAKVVAGRLHFPRTADEAVLPLEDGLAAPFVLEGKAKEHGTEAVVLAHLAHSAERLASGTLPVVPRACPLENTGYCDFAAICDFRPAARDLLEDPAPQPLFVDPPGPPKTPKEEELPAPAYAAASPVAEPPLKAAGDQVHAEGRRLARDLAQDVTLAAGAGSGKTTALVDRHTGALAAGCEPDEILCVTFTRKATAEMRSRVRARLLELDTASPDQRRRWIAGLSCAPIHTIDALAAVVVNEYADEPVQVVEGVSDAAAEFVAERLADEAGRKKGDLDRLFTAWPPAKVRATLEGLLQQDRALQATAKLGAAGVLAGWEAEADRLSPGLEKGMQKWLKQLSARLEKAEGKDEEFLNDALPGLEDAAAACEAHGVLVGLFALQRVKVRALGVSEELHAVRSEFKAWRAAMSGWFGNAYKVLKGLETPKDALRHLEQEAATSAAALAVARGWLEAFTAFREKRRLVTFPEVIERATQTIQAVDPADLAARLPFKHVMVDEFQDTDASQIRFIDTLVAALRRGRPAAPARLFVVGDPKQSIYRFRGAEVDLFQERTEQAGAGHGRLTTCFRALPPLTRAVDRLFDRLFDGRDPKGEPLDPEASVPWEPLSPRSDDGGEPCVELLRMPPVPPDSAAPEAEEREADVGDEDRDDAEEEVVDEADRPIEQALIRRIRELLADAATRPGQEGEAPVAILTHSWARAAHYGQLLREHGIPAFVQGGRGLLETREVRDLFHWLVALERQDDSAAFAGMLRGATIGLSDPGLYCLRQGFGLALREFCKEADVFRPADASPSLSRLARGFRFDAAAAIAAMQAAHGKKLPTEVADAIRTDAARLEVFQRAWQEAARAFGLTPAVHVLDLIVAGTAYEAALRARSNGLQALGNLRVFRALVREAQAGATPAEVVRAIRDLAEAGEDPAAAGLNLAPGAAVLLTTIHQSKGREWDVVVVPDLEKVGVKSRVSGCSLMRLARKTPKGWRRSWLPPSMLEDPSDLFATYAGVGAAVLTEATRGAERAESRRLMYVAFTRARRKLVISADWPDARKLGKWTQEAGELALPDSKEWRRDLVYALQCQVGADGGLLPTDVWKEGRDFAWVTPPGEGYGEATPLAQASGKVDPARIRLAAQAVALEPQVTITPSSLPEDPNPPPATLVRASGRGPAPATPFGSADEEGTAFHRTAQLWSYSGSCERALIERAVRGEYGDYKLAERVERIAAIIAWLETSHPTLVADLRDAASRGELFHEVAVGHLREDGAWVEALVDLLYRDRAGAWHVLDYKTNRIPDEATLKARLADYHAQVAAYAEALRGRLPGGASVASYGLWFVTAGVVGRWGAGGASGAQ